jgi:hypothetical protein
VGVWLKNSSAVRNRLFFTNFLNIVRGRWLLQRGCKILMNLNQGETIQNVLTTYKVENILTTKCLGLKLFIFEAIFTEKINITKLLLIE